MCERQNTILCAFDLRSLLISAYEICEWIYAEICRNDQEVTMVQIDGHKRHVYTKFQGDGRMQDMLHSTGRQVEYRHTNGEISTDRISTAGIGTRRRRIANPHPEVSDRVQRTVVSRYGEVRDILTETWPRVCRYAVFNDVRLAMITLATHIPSHITVAGVILWTAYDVLWL